jgi:putative membrane protein
MTYDERDGTAAYRMLRPRYCSAMVVLRHSQPIGCFRRCKPKFYVSTMIAYQGRDWWRALWHFHVSAAIHLLMKRVALVGMCGSAIAVVSLDFHTLNVRIGREYLSILGILLSLLLVFRTNMAYDRYYEGRKVWGMLVSQCRGLAMEMNALLPREAKSSRRYFAVLISNFPIALEGSLRNLKQHYLAMMAVNGTCERIKSTPIPYSYSIFIKCYITVFIMVMPLVLVDSCGWWMVPITMIGAYAMVGLEMIGNEIENPFGYDSNDLPITQLSNKIRVSVHDLLGVELPAEKKALATVPYSVVH